MYSMQYEQNSNDSVRSESYPQAEFSADYMERTTQVEDTTIPQNQSSHFGGEPLTLYASGGEPVTLYANNAGVVSQGFQNSHQEMPSNITMPHVVKMSKNMLKPKTFQSSVIQSQPRIVQKQMTFQTGNTRQFNGSPNSGTVQSIKLVPQAQKFYPLNTKYDNNSFQISLNLDEYGNPSVGLSGNHKKFIQHIHQAVLNFMRDNKIPAVSFCKHVLNNDQDDALSIFLTRNNWLLFTREEKMMYWRLNEWIKEPVTKRMYDLIQKETNIDRKTDMTNHFVETTTVKKKKSDHDTFSEEPFVPDAVNPTESRETVDTESSNVFQSEQQESSEPQEEFSVKSSSADGEALLAELQSRKIPGPPRTRTTPEERDAIRYWSSIYPNSSVEERKKLAWSLGLSTMSVWRLIAYDRKMSRKKSIRDEAEAKIASNYKYNDLNGGGVNYGDATGEPNERISVQNEYNENHKVTPCRQVETPTPSAESNSIQGSETSNQLQSRFITINSEKVKAVIRNAMKSNPAGFDPKRPFKVVIKPPDGPSKYNRLALDSYFKSKPNPTEAQIEYFVQCTKVPYKVAKKYLLERDSFKSDDNFVVAKNKEFQAKLDMVSERKKSSPNGGTQDPNHDYFQQEYQEQVQQDIFAQIPDDDQPHETAPPSQQFQPPSSQFSKLHKDKIAWLENFYHTTPNPDMQTIMDFSKCIDVPFGTVVEFLENMEKQNYSPFDHQETETSDNSLNYQQEFHKVDPDILDLVRKISKKTYSPILEKELRSLFGNNKIFCTLDDIKSYATANGMGYQAIYKKLNAQENIQLVSEQTCRRLVGAASNAAEYDKAEENEVNRYMPREANVASIKPEPVEYYDKSHEYQVDNFSNGYHNSSGYNLPEKLRNNPIDTAITTKQRVESVYDGLSVTMVPKIKQEPEEAADTGIPINNWLTSTELLFEENNTRSVNAVCKQEPQNHHDIGIEVIEIDVETSFDAENGKRKPPFIYESPSKKSKVADGNIPYDDSGYTTNEDSLADESALTASDSLNNIIFENVGKVNMLNESLDLFNDSVKDMDLVNDMFQKIENENFSMNPHVKVKKEVDQLSDEEKMMKALTDEPIKVSSESSGKKAEDEDPDKFNNLRKLFYGPFENFHPQLQVVSIKPGFKSDVFEVELSDGTEFSNNFYFKTGAAALKNNLMIRLKQLRYIGARICVESFEIIKQETCILGNPDPIEDQFFTDLRSSKIEPRDLFEISTPKTIVEYILLEENVRTIIESFGCNIDLFKFATDEEDMKKEILFSLCKSGKKLQSKLLKILSCFLSMPRQEIDQYVQYCQTKLGGSSVYQDHSYCNLATVFI